MDGKGPVVTPPTKFLGTPYLQDPDLTIYNGDVREGLRSLPDESVQMCVTSPPYWGLRDYGSEGQIGLEPTPEAYVQKMVEVFREVRRVLRKDGTCWINLGDTMNSRLNGSHGGWNGSSPEPQRTKNAGAVVPISAPGLKAKDLCMIPARVALALQADGWWLRSEITWCKPNPMPESVTDRPTQATEKVYLFSRSPRYFYDAEAVREPLQTWAEVNGRMVNLRGGQGYAVDRSAVSRPGGSNLTGNMAPGKHIAPNPSGRNLRNWWEIATEPYPEAHFATYPQELVRRCILAGTSERGCCPECGAPWVLETSVDYEITGRNETPERTEARRGQPIIVGFASGQRALRSSQTVGWKPSCDCPRTQWLDAGPACTILDPFFGSGTTGLVARKHGRKTIGIELSPEYCALAAKRLSQLSLLAEGAA